MCFGEQSIRRLGWRRGNRSTQRDQQVVGQTVQKYPKTIGHVTVIAQPVGTEFTLQFLVAIFAFSAFGVLLVNALRQHAGTRTIGALQVDRALDDDPPRRRPRAGPVVKAREEPLGFARPFELFACLLQEFFAFPFQDVVHTDPNRKLDVQTLAQFVHPRLRVTEIGPQPNPHVGKLLA